MPDILSSTQKAEQELAESLKEFLPETLEWKDVGGYPILYRKGFLGGIKSIAFLSSNKKITILSRVWKDAVTEAIQKYIVAHGGNIEIKLGFDEPKKFNRER